MSTLQLSDSLFVDIAEGDLFVYKYEDNYVVVQEVKDTVPALDQYTVEILSFHSKRHFILKRDNGYYWWEEIQY